MRQLIIILALSLAWSIPLGGDDNRVTELIEQLGDRKYKVRQRAHSALLKLGVEAWPQLSKAFETATELERKERLRQLLRAIRSKLARDVFKLGHPLPSSDRRSAAALLPDGSAAFYFARAAKRGYDYFRLDTATGKQVLLKQIEDSSDEPAASLLFYGGVTAAGRIAVISRLKNEAGQPREFSTGLLGTDGKVQWFKQAGAMYYPFLLDGDGKRAIFGEISLEKGRPKIPAPFRVSRMELSTRKKELLYQSDGAGFPLHLTRSLDGKRLIMLVSTRNREGSKIVVIDLASKKQLGTSPAFDWKDVVFDDNLLMISDRQGKRIYLTVRDGGGDRIKVYDVAAGTLKKISASSLILCGMLDDQYLSAYSGDKKQPCLVNARNGEILWQPGSKIVLLGRAGKQAIFARLKDGADKPRNWLGLSVGTLAPKVLAKLIKISKQR